MKKLKHHTKYESEVMRAIAYRRELKAHKQKQIATGIVSLVAFFMLAGCVGNSDFETAVAEGKIDFPRQTHIICDVMETEINTDGETEMHVIMQDGSIQNYVVIDAPEEIYEVCFKANDLDDFTTYEVVALR
jgi:hypothetical protein